MRAKHFVERVDEARIAAAIYAAERKSGGEIRVYISHRKREDALAAARARFLRLGMANTHHRSAVLIYFAPLTHKFALWGDIAAHEKCGEKFWQEIASAMTPFLKNGHLTQAIEHAVKAVGEVLGGKGGSG